MRKIETYPVAVSDLSFAIIPKHCPANKKFCRNETIPEICEFWVPAHISMFEKSVTINCRYEENSVKFIKEIEK